MHSFDIDGFDVAADAAGATAAVVVVVAGWLIRRVCVDVMYLEYYLGSMYDWLTFLPLLFHPSHFLTRPLSLSLPCSLTLSSFSSFHTAYQTNIRHFTLLVLYFRTILSWHNTATLSLSSISVSCTLTVYLRAPNPINFVVNSVIYVVFVFAAIAVDSISLHFSLCISACRLFVSAFSICIYFMY